ncbi:MAG TPA: conjugal transfer protein TraC [Advenella kashmirensis]|uniref:Conjugal transfer protein TraC n=1 Tax=Advenella kashmirensis TaxID=310575 RepID=A0A356LN40_9BURK|nr:conjugal transfer protein TraC [Advenella kashmirensis]
MAEKKTAFHEQLADKIITQLEAGTAPWQRPWDAPALILPHNESTGKPYRGGNMLNLMLAGYSDPRWLTYNQAREHGYQVKRGEKGSLIQTFRFHQEKQLRDPEGKPVRDDEGNAVIEQIRLNKPIIRTFVVFNALQITGMPPLVKAPHQWNGVEQIDKLMSATGAQIEHLPGNRAYYSPGRDKIVLPLKEQFSDSERYYSTALHELGHWTGHKTRLDRLVVNAFGSEGYAREELRAEISSMLIGQRLGISHDPGQHMAYVESWVKILKEDPAEIVRACHDAEKINNYLCVYLDRTSEKQEMVTLEQTVQATFQEKLPSLSNSEQERFKKMETMMHDVVKHLPEDSRETALVSFYQEQTRSLEQAGHLSQEVEIER